MILQSLVRHYDALAENGRVSPPGWSIARVSFALQIAPDGGLINIIPLKVPSKNKTGKKEVPQLMRVPEQIKKASGIAANFLCDSSSYMLGIDGKGKPERTKKCFEASKKLCHEILGSVNSEAAKSVLNFFDSWQPSEAEKNPVLAPFLDEIKEGGNIIFKTEDGSNVHNDNDVKEAWEEHCRKRSEDSVVMRCLVTGRKAPVARLHPSIKGIKGAQPSGASLVSYNSQASESYGHEQADKTGQGLNAPVSETAAFKYGAALNYMVADRDHVQRIADTTVLYWAEDAEPAYQDIFSADIFGSNEKITQADLDGIMKQIAGGGSTIAFNERTLNAENDFFVLGLAPNTSRLSVRFFLQSEFGTMLRNLNAHNRRLKIVQPMGENHELPLWNLLNETADQKSKDKNPPAPMAAAVLMAILKGTDYPQSFFESIMLRIRAEHDINWRKAAIIKAYFLKNKEVTVPKEVLKVELNEKSNYLPYVLGRLFATLEMVQKTANPGIKSTIRNKYFTSASATPAAIFPMLISLSQHHQRKLSEGSKVYYDKIISDLEGRIHETLPARFSLQEQGAFYLGYYHEKQALFTSDKKDDVKVKEEK